MCSMQAKLRSGGYVEVVPEGCQMPSDCFVLTDGSDFYGCTSEFTSAVYSDFKEAYDWVLAQVRFQPKVGSLWDYAGSIVVICGNSISKANTIWVMEWNSGGVAHAPLDELVARPDENGLSSDHLVGKFAEWARMGITEAMWWLGWWFEADHHPKSVWYYVAAMRGSPDKYGWALDRIAGDAQSEMRWRAELKPDLSFLADIPEIQTKRIGRNWREAVANAESAQHQLRKTREKGNENDQGIVDEQV